MIRTSGAYLRFICGADIPLAPLKGQGDEPEKYMEDLPPLDGTREGDLRWCGAFFAQNAEFLLGVKVPQTVSTICPPTDESAARPISILNGARAPSPRVCFENHKTGYLYDTMCSPSRFHLLIFGSDLQGPVRERVAAFSQQALGPRGFVAKYGGAEMFNVVLILKCLPDESDDLLAGEDLKYISESATIVYDDRSPDEDAHYWYGINHARGAVVAVRPDLWVGMSCWPEQCRRMEEYFASFLVEQAVDVPRSRSRINGLAKKVQLNGLHAVNSVEGLNAQTDPVGKGLFVDANGYGEKGNLIKTNGPPQFNAADNGPNGVTKGNGAGNEMKSPVGKIDSYVSRSAINGKTHGVNGWVRNEDMLGAMVSLMGRRVG